MTLTQFKALNELAEGYSIPHGVAVALLKKGWVKFSEGGPMVLTAEGRAALRDAGARGSHQEMIEAALGI